MYIDRCVDQLVKVATPGTEEELRASAALTIAYNRINTVRRCIVAKESGMPYVADVAVRNLLKNEGVIYNREKSLALLDARCAVIQDAKMRLEGGRVETVA